MGCNRCVKQSLGCHYSMQRQMGRPKKRIREDEDIDASRVPGSNTWTNTNNSQFMPFGVGDDTATTSEARQRRPPVFLALMDKPRMFPQPPYTSDERNDFWHTEQSISNPPTASSWPDFSSVSAATSNMSLIPSDLPRIQPYPLYSPNSEAPNASAQCTCLSYLYLCLSHISSLAEFPISHNTLCSLFLASKTARNVIRCEICPKRFATGMQNVMFLGTLLNVIADTWLRVSQANAEVLGRETAPVPYVASLMQNPNPMESWRTWLRRTVRSAVIGGPIEDAGRSQCSDSPDLLSLIKEFEERQRSWHSNGTSHPLYQSPQSQNLGAQPSGGAHGVDDRRNHQTSFDAGMIARNEGDLLCFQVVGSARKVISKFNFQPHEYPNGVVS